MDYYQDLQDAYSRAVKVKCPYGNCVIMVDSRSNKILSSFGAFACACDTTAGWRSQYVEGMGKPRIPVKGRGRHGSRAARSKRRHKDVLPGGVTIKMDDLD